MRETRSSGSVRGASGDGRPYREHDWLVAQQPAEGTESSRSGLTDWTGLHAPKGAIHGGKGEPASW